MTQLAERGYLEAIAHWQAYGRTLGAEFTSAIYILTPEVVILGGGGSASAHLSPPFLVKCSSEYTLALAKIYRLSKRPLATKRAW